jgi:hypothetical protein
MNKKLFFLLIPLLPLLAFTKYYIEIKAEEEAVKELVLGSYVNGAFNALDPDAMLKGFHPDFAIFSAKGELLQRYEIGTWVEGVRKRKNDPEFDASKNAWEHKFTNVQVTGNAATLRVDLTRNGKHIYTDYLSLLKFDSGWKIVAKVYYQHPRD